MEVKWERQWTHRKPRAFGIPVVLKLGTCSGGEPPTVKCDS